MVVRLGRTKKGNRCEGVVKTAGASKYSWPEPSGVKAPGVYPRFDIIGVRWTMTHILNQHINSDMYMYIGLRKIRSRSIKRQWSGSIIRT